MSCILFAKSGNPTEWSNGHRSPSGQGGGGLEGGWAGRSPERLGKGRGSGSKSSLGPQRREQ